MGAFIFGILCSVAGGEAIPRLLRWNGKYVDSFFKPIVGGGQAKAGPKAQA